MNVKEEIWSWHPDHRNHIRFYEPQPKEQTSVQPAVAPHKHAAVIKAWADGVPIQFMERDTAPVGLRGVWRDMMAGTNPTWSYKLSYRVSRPVPPSAEDIAEALLTLNVEPPSLARDKLNKARRTVAALKASREGSIESLA